MIAPSLHQLAALCATKGIEHVILCPGSRSAPLALAFLRSGKFTCYTFSDERCAAFVGLGIAQQTNRPVILVCTSGSAAYNFAPAVAEAYYQQVPLLVITADRPKEWIDQLDGQTIRQPRIFGEHVKRYAELPADFVHPDAEWFANRIGNELINFAASYPRGPVHLNVPLREPLYPSANEKVAAVNPRSITETPGQPTLSDSEWNSLLATINQSRKVLVVAGQQGNNPSLRDSLHALTQTHRWPVVGDILSNLHALPGFIGHADTFLGQLPEKMKHGLKPDLLITFGQSLVAKNLKLFLRNFPPQAHWHIQPGGEAPDTFKGLTRIIRTDPQYFFDQLQRRTLDQQVAHRVYTDEWSQHEVQARSAVDSFLESQEHGEFSLVHNLLRHLPERCNLHLANSMSVRYANHVGLLDTQHGVHVYGNRGTSGIDGCTSTATGHALSNSVPNVLVTGDQAFFYDRNAFWHNYPLPNLLVVVLNNHGGIIFNLIDGPSSLPEAEEFFITRQPLRAKALAQEFGYTYTEGTNPNWKDFFQPGSDTKIHELESSQTQNKSIFEAFKKHIRKSYEAN